MLYHRHEKSKGVSHVNSEDAEILRDSGGGIYKLPVRIFSGSSLELLT